MRPSEGVRWPTIKTKRNLQVLFRKKTPSRLLKKGLQPHLGQKLRRGPEKRFSIIFRPEKKGLPFVYGTSLESFKSFVGECCKNSSGEPKLKAKHRPDKITLRPEWPARQTLTPLLLYCF